MTNITLLDGGMGQELVRRSGEAPTPLWATQVMLDHPGLVEAIHVDYFDAGATVATVNSYAIHHDRFVDTPLEGKFGELHAAALTEAKAARAKHPSGQIAGAIGPLVATYRPDLTPDHDISVRLYSEVVETLAPECDLILYESVASLGHARAALEAGLKTTKPVWLAFTVDDMDGSRLRSGESVAEATALAAQSAAAVLANCSVPEAMPAALKAMSTSGLPFGAYANGFTQISNAFLDEKPTVDTLETRNDLTPETYADHVMAWVDMGATIVGGCCETGPAHIAEIARRLKEAGHTIV